MTKTGTKTAAPAVKKAAAKPAVKKFTLTIDIETPAGYNGTYCYVCGNAKELGCWDISKAKRADVVNGKAELKVSLDAGSFIEFKVTASNSWVTVQKGANYEEQQNNWVQMDSDRTYDVKVWHFSTII